MYTHSRRVKFNVFLMKCLLKDTKEGKLVLSRRGCKVNHILYRKRHNGPVNEDTLLPNDTVSKIALLLFFSIGILQPRLTAKSGVYVLLTRPEDITVGKSTLYARKNENKPTRSLRDPQPVLIFGSCCKTLKNW